MVRAQNKETVLKLLQEEDPMKKEEKMQEAFEKSTRTDDDLLEGASFAGGGPEPEPVDIGGAEQVGAERREGWRKRGRPGGEARASNRAMGQEGPRVSQPGGGMEGMEPQALHAQPRKNCTPAVPPAPICQDGEVLRRRINKPKHQDMFVKAVLGTKDD